MSRHQPIFGEHPTITHYWIEIFKSCCLLMFSKPGLGIGGVLRNSRGEVLFMFSKFVGVCDSNEALVLAILEALRYFSRFFNGVLVVESDSSNAVASVSNYWQILLPMH
eukprot:TRINITY_DN9427_c0_g2_i3.p1 TRINITY_DN9427_c0_g2~~TRINITY_DN9427_c0_g2_i3.p1  ORF type:complete len:109 (+),score=10.84 TRINITY_DN9427_c0_g2_i3:826-1152(+)